MPAGDEGLEHLLAGGADHHRAVGVDADRAGLEPALVRAVLGAPEGSALGQQRDRATHRPVHRRPTFLGPPATALAAACWSTTTTLTVPPEMEVTAATEPPVGTVVAEFWTVVWAEPASTVESPEVIAPVPVIADWTAATLRWLRARPRVSPPGIATGLDQSWPGVGVLHDGGAGRFGDVADQVVLLGAGGDRRLGEQVDPDRLQRAPHHRRVEVADGAGLVGVERVQVELGQRDRGAQGERDVVDQRDRRDLDVAVDADRGVGRHLAEAPVVGQPGLGGER